VLSAAIFLQLHFVPLSKGFTLQSLTRNPFPKKISVKITFALKIVDFMIVLEFADAFT